MNSLRIRPKFSVLSPKPQDQIVAELQGKNTDDHGSHPCRLQVFPNRFKLSIRKEHQHYWSPVLEVTMEEEEEGTLLTGRYGPHQNVWTLFTMLYLGIGILTLFISIIGLARMSLGLSARILWTIPVLVVTALFLYIVSQIGQKLGSDEITSLHHLVEELLDRKIDIK